MMSLPSSLGESVGVQLCFQRWPVCWTPQGASARDHEFEHWGPPSRWFGPSNSWRWTRAVQVCPWSWKETIINGLARRRSEFRFFDDSAVFWHFFGKFSSRNCLFFIRFSSNFSKTFSECLPKNLDASESNPKVWQMFRQMFGQNSADCCHFSFSFSKSRLKWTKKPETLTKRKEVVTRSVLHGGGWSKTPRITRGRDGAHLAPSFTM